jgi:hypothetical protein
MMLPVARKTIQGLAIQGGEPMASVGYAVIAFIGAVVTSVIMGCMLSLPAHKVLVSAVLGANMTVLCAAAITHLRDLPAERRRHLKQKRQDCQAKQPVQS